MTYELDLLSCLWLEPTMFLLSVRERHVTAGWFLTTTTAESTTTYMRANGQWLDSRDRWLAPNDPRRLRLNELLCAWWAERALSKAVGLPYDETPLTA